MFRNVQTAAAEVAVSDTNKKRLAGYAKFNDPLFIGIP